MSLSSCNMLPERVRNMRQMKDILHVEEMVLGEIEQILEEMYQRASLLHEELINEEWLERRLAERTHASAYVKSYADRLRVEILLDISRQNDLNMQDVRRFINKWLPAHLAYEISSQTCIQSTVHFAAIFQYDEILTVRQVMA